MGANFGAGAAGAVTGAQLGSSFGPIGTGVGAVAGGIMGLFGSKKKKKKPKRISSLDSQQQELYRQKYDALQGKGQFADMYNFNPEAANQNFDQNVARPAYRDFQEKAIPSITGQFRGNNIMNSSYTGSALANAGRDVQESLDAKRANMIYQGSQDAMKRKYDSIDNMLNMQTFAYQRPQESPGTPVDQILNTAGGAAGNWFADYLGNKSSGASKNPLSSGYDTMFRQQGVY